MATKFIDRLCFLFTGKLEEEKDNDKYDPISARVADIRRRIADLESRIGRTKQSYQTPKVQRQESLPMEKTKDTKSSSLRDDELAAIKAKLLGKK